VEIATLEFVKNDPKITHAWCMYDWANSVFSLTIATSIFPIYFQNVTGDEQGMVQFLGLTLHNTVLYSYILSFAFLLVALINPLLSGLSDVAGLRKRFISIFTLLGSLACLFLYAFDSDRLWVGVWGFAIATMGYAGSLVFYNAYLPEIATPDRFDKLSAKGYALGYIGSVILLIVNLITIDFHSFFGFATETQAVRFSFLTVGLWWGLFGAYSISKMPAEGGKIKAKTNLLFKGYKESLKVFRNIQKVKLQRHFLWTFFFYSMGTQTVMYVATLFGTDELKLPADRLIISILLIQFIGVAGAYFFAWVSKKLGVFSSIAIMILIWIVVCVAAYFTYYEWQFYLLAVLVGSVMGGIQSQSRSAFASIIPGDKDNASYFSFYELSEKVAIVLGTFSYGLLIELSGNMRNSVLLLTTFFMIGFLMIVRLINSKRRLLKTN
jgi:UMF1 family MFS transporter